VALRSKSKGKVLTLMKYHLGLWSSSIMVYLMTIKKNINYEKESFIKRNSKTKRKRT